jgi:hypothetical protein
MAAAMAIIIMRGPESCFCMSNLNGAFIVFVFVFFLEHNRRLAE